ncbi:phage shock protein E [Aurantimicrobium minutum]|uniref:rhodanese-like domain-containing protein n=1 Tax=Aurantimicrobium minutum TaxID=708131 RepID=UPI002476F44E|nr:rhodanese-like domain-containing protein [Aurantimicrobium minutum]MDH6532179.1 phage shock protein E [Aurantimicrobium minutum]
MKKIFAIIAIALAATFALAACAPAADPIAVGENTIIVDVRTPAEYNEGHLEGAVNIDVQAPDFLIILGQLPTDGDYIVYCRSGNRSAQAVEIMTTKGFTNVTDAGGMDAASAATGLPIVK